MNELAICSGVGMLSEGLRAGLGYLGIKTRTVCHIEREAHAASVLVSRMQDGSLDAAPIWSDLCTFDAAAWCGVVDIVVAGFPCQDISLAGRRAGLDGARSGLFFDILKIADDCGAQYLFLENVAGIASATATSLDQAVAAEITGERYRPAGDAVGESDEAVLERAAARVVGELADRGWDAEWLTLSAAEVGASHWRERWFCWAWRSVDYAGCVQRCEGHEQGQSTSAEAGKIQANDGIANRSGNVGTTDKQRTHRSSAPRQQTGGSQLTKSGGFVADTQCQRDERRRDTGIMACASCENQGCDGCEQRPAPDGGNGAMGAMADTGSAGQQRRELGRACIGHGGQKTHGSTSQFCGLFAPGPSDPRWRDIIAAKPWIAPAIDKTTEPVLCGMADGLDFNNRSQRLKCVGNGVVALCAATAVVQLFRRSGLMNK